MSLLLMHEPPMDSRGSLRENPLFFYRLGVDVVPATYAEQAALLQPHLVGLSGRPPAPFQ